MTWSTAGHACARCGRPVFGRSGSPCGPCLAVLMADRDRGEYDPDAALERENADRDDGRE